MTDELTKLIRKVSALAEKDPAGRGLLSLGPGQDVKKALDMIKSAGRALIVTGFPIISRGVGETDGPIGAVTLASALVKSGRQAWIMTDKYSFPLVSACIEAAGSDNIGLYQLAMDGDCRQAALKISPDIIIAIERPGKGADGHFHNMRGVVVDSLIADTDGLLSLGLPVIGIGDGGNELGMGNYFPLLERSGRGDMAAVGRSDAALAAGVSNWWGWGLAALLSGLEGRDLMGDEERQKAMLAAVIEAGGVDGVLGRPVMSVDGIELGGIDEIFAPMRAAMLGHISRSGR